MDYYLIFAVVAVYSSNPSSPTYAMKRHVMLARRNPTHHLTWSRYTSLLQRVNCSCTKNVSLGVRVTDNASTSTKSVISVLTVQISQMRPIALQHVTLKKDTANGQMLRLETTMTGFVTRAKPLQNSLGLLLTILTTHQQVCVISCIFLCIVNRGFINRSSDSHGLPVRVLMHFSQAYVAKIWCIEQRWLIEFNLCWLLQPIQSTNFSWLRLAD